MKFIASSRADIPQPIEIAAKLARSLESVGEILACAKVNDTLTTDDSLWDRASKALVLMIQAQQAWKEGLEYENPS